MDNNNNDNKQNSINSLPEYKIRTMEGDIDKIKGGISLPPEELPVVKPKIDLNHNSSPVEIAEKIQKPIEISSIEYSVKPPIKSPDVPLKPIDAKPVNIEPPLPRIIETPSVPKIEFPQTPKPKSSLPEIEDFIVPKKAEEKIKTENLSIENIFEQKPVSGKQKWIWIILAIVIIVLALLGYLYWRGLKAEKASNPQTIETEYKLQIPNSLISVENTKTIKIENNVQLLILLQDEKVGTLKTFTRIVPTKISPTTGKEEVLSLSNLIEELNISVYPYVLSEFRNNYTLVLYGQEENEKRLGIIIQTSGNNNIREQLKYWESTIINDAYNLFLGKEPQIPTNKNFSDSSHNGTPIRFINFPNPDISMDYALPGNLFILSTSKESLRAIIDRIK